MRKKAGAGKKLKSGAVKKIFVTLGTHPQQFDRLLKEVDALVAASKIRGKVFAQTGYGSYEPKNYSHQKFLGLEEFKSRIGWADVVITHAGEGNVGLCKNLGKKMVVVPRRKEFGEHTNDHQLELAGIVELKRLGLVAWDVEELYDKILLVKGFVPARVARGRINSILEEYSEKELRW